MCRLTTNGARVIYPFRTPEFILIFSRVCVALCVVFCVVFYDHWLPDWPLSCHSIHRLLLPLWHLLTFHIIRKSWTVVDNAFGEFDPCTLNISFVDFEKEYSNYSRYKRLNVSSLLNSPYFTSDSQYCRYLVFPI